MKIDELEKIATKDRAEHTPIKGTSWSDDETDTVIRYFNRVPMKTLLQYLPGRTAVMVRSKFQQMKISKKWKSQLNATQEIS